ncbi:MAG: hypothetical protein ACRESZ_19230 [Methylococcales bacterium]
MANALAFSMFRLRRFIAATQQDNQFAASYREIKAIAFANKNPHFAAAFADRRYIAQVARAHPGQPSMPLS